MHVCRYECVCLRKFLSVLTSDPGANPSYANPSRALVVFLLYLIFIDAPFPRRAGNGSHDPSVSDLRQASWRLSTRLSLSSTQDHTTTLVTTLAQYQSLPNTAVELIPVFAWGVQVPFSSQTLVFNSVTVSLGSHTVPCAQDSRDTLRTVEGTCTAQTLPTDASHE